MLPITKPLLPSSSPLRHLLLLFSSTTTSISPATATATATATSTSTPIAETVLYVLKSLQQHPLKALDFYHHATNRLRLRPTPSILGVMLRTLACRDTIDQFRSLARDPDLPSIDGATYFSILVALKKQNLAVDADELRRLYARQGAGLGEGGKLVAAAAQVIISGEMGEGFEEKLETLGLCLSAPEIENILQEVKDHPFSSLGFFRWAEKKLGHKHGSSTYNAMLKVLARSESIKEFWIMMEEMKGEGHNLDIDTYIRLMRIFQKGKVLEDAVKLYEFMMDSPSKPAMHECGILLRKISSADTVDVGLVHRVVNTYESHGYSLSKVEYDGILRFLTKRGEIDEAGQVVMKMKAAGFEPDNITYSQMLFGLCRAKRFTDALKVLDDMEAAGCMPDVKTWTILIQGHFLVGEVDAALACLKNMVGRNYELDGELLDVVVKGLCSHGRISDAHTIFIDMTKIGVKPWQATFKCLIEKLLDGKDLENAMRLVGLMKKFQFPLYADPFPLYISKSGTIEDARDFLSMLSAKGHRSPASYLHIFRSFFKEGRYSEARDLLLKSPHHIRKQPDIAKLFGSLKPANTT